jgi:hypothetical protein
MNHQHPPSADDNDAYVWVDHRADELSIVEEVSALLDEQDALEAREDTETISLVHRGSSHVVPLAFSPHDRYIMISSLAHLLRDRYRFFVLDSSLGSDTHGLHVVPADAVRAWANLPGHLIPLDIGYDYFHKIRVPYLGGENSAPSFAADQQRIKSESNAMKTFVEAMMTGKMTDGAAATLAAAVAANPEAKKAVPGQSQAEIAAEIQKAFAEEMASPEMQGLRREQEKALADLRSLVGKASRPWWKF